MRSYAVDFIVKRGGERYYRVFVEEETTKLAILKAQKLWYDQDIAHMFNIIARHEVPHGEEKYNEFMKLSL